MVASMAEPYNNRMQPDFGKLRLPQPLMRSVEMSIVCRLLPPALVY